jgi:hypothetical protein
MTVMQRDPVQVPRKSGIFALLNSRRRFAYVAYTSDLQKRSHSLAHMLQNQKTHWSIKDLPQHPAGEYLFLVLHEDTSPERAQRLVTATQKQFTEKRYTIVSGARSAVPLVTFKGQEMPLTDAIKIAKCKTKYITVWRRLERGWSVAQALDVEPHPVRWDPESTKSRLKRKDARTRKRATASPV